MRAAFGLDVVVPALVSAACAKWAPPPRRDRRAWRLPRSYVEIWRTASGCLRSSRPIRKSAGLLHPRLGRLRFNTFR